MTWEEFLEKMIKLVTSFGIKLLGAILVLVIALKIIGSIKKWIKKSPKLDKVDPGVRTFMYSFVSIGLYVVLVIVVAGMIGIPATSFITVLASCGVAIGLALQGSLSNFAGGLMILLFKPFKVGDYIEASGESGTVVEITVVYTILLTPDNKRITIPNGTLTNSVIENYSAEDLRRVDLTFKTAVDSDVNQVKEILEKVASAHPLALAEPEPMVRLSDHNTSSLTFITRVWCKTDDYWTVHFDLKESVERAFAENHIQIPYPQVDIHVKDTDKK